MRVDGSIICRAVFIMNTALRAFCPQKGQNAAIADNLHPKHKCLV
jgi:hypothetical protein